MRSQSRSQCPKVIKKGRVKIFTMNEGESRKERKQSSVKGTQEQGCHEGRRSDSLQTEGESAYIAHPVGWP